jgi:hypothetical protein
VADESDASHPAVPSEDCTAARGEALPYRAQMIGLCAIAPNATPNASSSHVV